MWIVLITFTDDTDSQAFGPYATETEAEVAIERDFQRPHPDHDRVRNIEPVEIKPPPLG